ncbi:hypothetical protein K0M31_009639, partial [Melipona bicolor]
LKDRGKLNSERHGSPAKPLGKFRTRCSLSLDDLLASQLGETSAATDSSAATVKIVPDLGNFAPTSAK